MSSDPEKPIEKLLRRWSSARQKQAGENWEMHPVNRRILHQEVTRQFGRKAANQAGWFSRMLTASWLKPAGAIVVVVVLVISSWVLFWPPSGKDQRSLARNQAPASAPGQVPGELAMNDKAAKTEEKNNPAETKQLLANNAPVAPQLEKTSSATVMVAAKDSGPSRESLLDEGAARDATKKAMVPNEEQSPLVVASSPAPAARLENLQRYGMARGLGGGVAPAPAAEPKGLLLSGTAERGLTEKEAGTATVAFDSAVSGAAVPSNLIQYGRFVAAQNQTAAWQDNAGLARRSVSLASSTAGRQSQPASAILTSFQMEQVGPVLRVIDTDNSVYTGTIQGTNMVTTAAALPAGAATADQEQDKIKAQVQSPQSANQNFAAFFRVSGTNRSLNQRVVFSGTLSELTNAYVAGANTQNQGGGGGIGGAVNPRLTNQPMQSFQVNGTAWVGGTQPLQINAVPATK